MRIVAIRPRSPARLGTYSEGLHWWGCRAFVVPRILATLSAMAHEHPRISSFSIIDLEAGDAVDFEEEADFALIFAESQDIPSIRYLCGRFRAKRIHTLLAGPFVTSIPSRVNFVDTRLRGAVESAFKAFLDALSAGDALGTDLLGDEDCDLAHFPRPNWHGLDLSSYLYGEVEVSREGLGEGGRLRIKPVERVLAEIDVLSEGGIRRIRLVTPGLWAEPSEASAFLEALASRGRASFFLSTSGSENMLDVMSPDVFAAAGFKRLEILCSFSRKGEEGEAMHSRLARGIRECNARGIHVVLRRMYGGEESEGVIRRWMQGLPATPVVESDRVEPGTLRYERFAAQKRLARGGRDADLRREPLDGPNYIPEGMNRADIRDALRILLHELYAPEAVVERMVHLAQGDRLSLVELRAFGRMLVEAPRLREERRHALTMRFLVELAKSGIWPLRWDRAFEAFLEEVANRSLVERVIAGRELEHALNRRSVKQVLLGFAAKLAARAA